LSVKSKVFAAAATLTLVGGVGAVGVMSASAATPSCGSTCADVFSREFGTHHTPAFVLDVFQQAAKVGQPVILFRTSDTDPAEDFSAEFNGTTSDFFAAGLMSAAIDLHYGSGIGMAGVTAAGNGYPDDPAFELEYTPYGVASGLCAGVAATAQQGTKVTLQPCGYTSKTAWVVDTLDTTITHGYVPLINGSDTTFSHPFVLDYPKNGYPTNTPRPQLETDSLTGFTGAFLVPELGTVNDNQLWGADFGVLR